MLVAKVSPITGELNTMNLPLTPEQVEAWRAGALIQDIMPHLSAQEREFLVSGVTPEEWRRVFGDE
ncbi:MAG: hypothetical protein M3511_12390 [Deinococcota bacterium]|nr:hypothetical protein [Deinococcota bacterium]